MTNEVFSVSARLINFFFLIVFYSIELKKFKKI